MMRRTATRHALRCPDEAAEEARPRDLRLPRASLLRDARIPLGQRQAIAARVTGAFGNAQIARAVLARSTLSDALKKVWLEEGKAAFFDRLRELREPDPDLLDFVESELEGDDLWLSRNLILYGREASWPIALRVERELKGWADCGGVPAVFVILREAGGTEAHNAALAETLGRVITNLDTLWIAQRLQAFGPEPGWPADVQTELEQRRRDAVVGELTSMVGEQAAWKPSQGRFTREHSHDEATTFAQWAEAGSESPAPRLSPAMNLNCWEMIMLAAYNAGSLSWQWIHEVYLARPQDANADPNAWFKFLSRRLTPAGAARYGRGGPPPAAGQIVLFDAPDRPGPFDGSDHVALALGGNEVLSFLAPDGGVENEFGRVGATEVTTIEALARRLDAEKGGDVHRSRTIVKFGAPPW